MKAVAYYRVSTAAQGRSGLGLDAQRRAVADLCATRGLTLLDEYTEVESGKRDDRPQLAEALHRAKVSGAVLLVAKMDRVGRKAARLLTLLAEGGVKFIAADDPDADWTSIAIKAVIAQHEGDAISRRTRDALAAARKRGTKLGNPNGAACLHRAGKGNSVAVAARKDAVDSRARALAFEIERARAGGAESLRDIADALNARGVEASRGGQWHPSGVKRLLARLSDLI